MMISITTKGQNAKTVHIAHNSLCAPTLCGQSPSNLDLTFEASTREATCKRCIKSHAAESTKW